MFKKGHANDAARADIAERMVKKAQLISFSLDYDWENPQSADATGIVEAPDNMTDEQLTQTLIDKDREITEEFSPPEPETGYATYVVYQVNGEDVEANGQYHWVTNAIIDYLSRNPDVRQFTLSGVVE